MRSTLILILAVIPAVAPAASFSLGAVLRAGTQADVELLGGSTSATTTASGNFFPYWLNGIDHTFRLNYDASSNTATLSANWLGIFTSSTVWNPAGGAPSSSARNWTIAAGGITATAQNLAVANTSIRLQNLSITGPGLGVINPPNLLAAQTGAGTVTSSNGSAITFTTPNGAGSWVLDGQIRFTGLAGLFGSPGATGDQLRATLDILAADVPEPATLLISALGFAALRVLHHLRNRGRLAAAITTLSINSQPKIGPVA